MIRPTQVNKIALRGDESYDTHKKTTSKRVAGNAGSLLRSKKSNKRVRSVAGSALGQTRGKKH